MSSIRWFKVTALAEAVSYLVLLAASVAKRTLDMHEAVAVGDRCTASSSSCTWPSPSTSARGLGCNGWTTVMVVVARVPSS